MADWDAERYHRVSGPQYDWGQRVLARLQPRAGERILDLGCGTGRLTQQLVRHAAGGPPRVIGLDRSRSMLSVARAAAREAPLSITFVQGDGTALPFGPVFDAVFSTATLHWIQDHQAVFGNVCTALSPGGRFVAQCGGRGNLQRMLQHATTLMSAPPYHEHFAGWQDPWHFADPETTADRLRRAGFTEVSTWLEEAPVDLGGAASYAEFVSCVCIRHHLERLPPDLRDAFTRDLTRAAATDTPAFTLDYWRLNIRASKAAA